MHVPTSSDKLVTVFGGSGFLGRHVVQTLARRGYRIRAAVRRPDLAGDLHPMGSVGQIKAIQANIRYRWSVERAMEGADVVVNLVGILAESGRQSFDTIHALGARAIAESARAQRIREMVHVSAIGADPNSDIAYLRSKGEGEQAVLETISAAVVVRPSIVFGPEDKFFNRFASLARLSPVLPLIGGGKTRFQPVFAGDVAEAIARAVDRATKPGIILELGGPEVVTFRQIMERILAVTNRRRALVNIPFGVAKAMGRVGAFLPGSPLTAEQVSMLQLDNVVSEEAKSEGRTLEGIGITPTAMELILPTYLRRFREQGEFTRPRAV